MADVISRIVLQASGGDQVAREVQKVKKAYTEAGEAAKGMTASAGTGTSDAFSRATAKPQSVVAEESSRLGANSEYDRRVAERQAQHNGLAAQNLRGGAAIDGRNAAQGIHAATQIAGGDPVGAGAGMLTSLGRFGKLGVAGLVVGAVAAGGNALANKALERQQQLWYGLGQGLGQGEYDPFRDSVRSLEEKGLAPNLMEYLSALRASGGSFDAATAENALRMNFSTGVQASALANLQGTMERAGAGSAGRTLLDTSTLAGGLTAAKAETTFGRAAMGDFYTSVSAAIESAMTRGFERGSGIFQRSYSNFVQGISDFSVFGGVSGEAAVSMFNQVQQGIARSERGLQTPQDAAAFIAMREPGESYVDTILRMSSPESEMARYERLRDRAGGDRDSLVLMVAQEFGMTIRQADAYVRTKEGRIRQNERNAANAAAGRTTGVPEVTFDSGVLEDQAAQSRRQNLGQDAQEGAADVLTGLQNWTEERLGGVYRRLFGRRGTPEDEARAQFLDEALGGYRGTSRYDGPTTPSTYGSAVPESLRNELEALAGNVMLGTPMEGEMRGLDAGLFDHFRLYESYRTGNTAGMSDARLRYFGENEENFQAALALMDQLSGSISSGEVGALEINQAMRHANLTDDWDLNKGVFSIIDILSGLRDLVQEYGSTEIQTDAGSTE